jgi:hypothetical protein
VRARRHVLGKPVGRLSEESRVDPQGGDAGPGGGQFAPGGGEVAVEVG